MGQKKNIRVTYDGVSGSRVRLTFMEGERVTYVHRVSRKDAAALGRALLAHAKEVVA